MMNEFRTENDPGTEPTSEPSVKTWDRLAAFLRSNRKIVALSLTGRWKGYPKDLVIEFVNKGTIQSREYQRAKPLIGKGHEYVEPGEYMNQVETWTRADTEREYFETLELVTDMLIGEA
jgi:hypothetical protein